MLKHQPQIASPPTNRIAPSWRWIAVLVASILLHLIALEWAKGVISIPNWHDEPVNTVTVQLEAPELPTPIVTEPKPLPKPAPKPRVRVAPKPTLPANPVAPAAPEPQPDSTPTTALTQDAPANKDATADSKSSTEPSTDQMPPTASDAKTPPERSLPHYKVNLPPSVEVKYDVKRMSGDGTSMTGSGLIRWENGGSNYSVNGQASKFFLNILHFKSEGVLDDYGIAPNLYSQQAMLRSETNTHFNRDERNSISFSSSKLSLPRKGGEQDRASVMWELAGIGRGDQEKFVPDAHIDLFVASDHDGEIWQIMVLGQEEIETGSGTTMAWHVVRTPNPGSRDDKIDIWLAPQYEWSPIQILYTYKNGGYLYMSMSSFRALQVASKPVEALH
jgi:hypothetical protein